MLNWWTDLLASGAGGALIAIVIAAFAVLLVGNAIIWPIAGLKHLATRDR